MRTLYQQFLDWRVQLYNELDRYPLPLLRSLVYDMQQALARAQAELDRREQSAHPE